MQVRDIEGQMSIDIKLNDASHVATARNKSDDPTEITEENDEDSVFVGTFEDQEAMKSKLPASFEEQANKTGRSKRGKSIKQQKNADKQGLNKKKGKNNQTNCCEPSCVCKCNMKATPRGGG